MLRSVFQYYYTFYFIRIWEHIYRLTFDRSVAMFSHIVQIPAKRMRIAGNIYNPLRCQKRHRLQKGFAAAAPGRIHKYYIYLRTLTGGCCRKPSHIFSGIFIIKSNIFTVISSCVGDRVSDRRRVQFHADHLLCTGRRRHSDRTDCCRWKHSLGVCSCSTYCLIERSRKCLW